MRLTTSDDKAPKTTMLKNNGVEGTVQAYAPGHWQQQPLSVTAQRPIAFNALTPASIYQLQRTIGNQAVSQLINTNQAATHHPVHKSSATAISALIQRQTQPLSPANAACTPELIQDPNLLAFTEAFNREFRSILHLFESTTQSGDSATGEVGTPVAESSSESSSQEPVTQRGIQQVETSENSQAEAHHASGNRQAGTQSGNEVDACTLQQLFTVTQRAKLMAFCQNHQIPDRLFNGDDVGQVTAQQRLLMSAHILANGTYRPGSFEQRVHARMCFHWVHITHHYAGATPAGTLSSGIMGNFDQGGNIVFGSGGSPQVFFGARTNADELPEQEAGGIGPVPQGTGHADALEQGARGIHRRQSLPISRFGELQPGDWLWYYNANRSAGGSHSVIFSRWASGEQEAGGFRYRAAVCFSQGRPEHGGREHNVNLGEAYVDTGNVKIYPITYVSRVNQGARPAQTVAELLPSASRRREERLQEANQSYLNRIRRRYRRPVDLQRFMDHLRDENRQYITTINSRLTPGQRDLLNEANRTDNLETLIRLTQRLRMLSNNSTVLERNMESTYTGRLDARHAEISAQVTAEQQRLEREIAQLDAEVAPIEEQIETLNQRRETLDPSPQLRALHQEASRVWQRIRALPRRDPERSPLTTRRQEILAQIATLGVSYRSNRREISDIQQQIRTLRRAIKTLTVRRRRLEQQQQQQQAALPYGLVHPGNLGSQDQRRLTGQIEDLYTIQQMEEFLGAKGEPPV